MTITAQANQWNISGQILVDNAHAILNESKNFKIDADFRVNLAAVTDVDTAALSLLLEWQRRAAASDKKVTFTDVPASLMSLATLYGVAEYLSIERH